MSAANVLLESDSSTDPENTTEILLTHPQHQTYMTDVTLEHKTSLLCQFFKIEIYASSEAE